MKKSRSWSQSRDPWQFFESLGIGIKSFGLEKKVSVSVSKNLVSLKKSRYRYWKIWSRKKSLGIGLGKFGLGKKVSVLVSEKFVSDKKSRSRYRSKFWSRHTVLSTRYKVLEVQPNLLITGTRKFLKIQKAKHLKRWHGLNLGLNEVKPNLLLEMQGET